MKRFLLLLTLTFWSLNLFGASTELLEFSATWCAPCKKMVPAVKQLIEEGYTVQTINADKQPELAQKYNITSLPTSIVLRDGKETERIVGLTTVEELRKRLGEPPIKLSAPPPQAEITKDRILIKPFVNEKGLMRAHLELVFDDPAAREYFTPVWIQKLSEGIDVFLQKSRMVQPLKAETPKEDPSKEETELPLPDSFLEAAEQFPGAAVHRSTAHPLLMSLAKRQADYQASVGVQGHQNFEQRMAEIQSTLGITPTEICAESWPWMTNDSQKNLWLDAFKAWSQSPGHWSVASKQFQYYGAANARGRNGIWYSTIIAAPEGGGQTDKVKVRAIVKERTKNVVVVDEVSMIRKAAERVGAQVCLGENSPALNTLALQGAKLQAEYNRCGHWVRHGKAEVAAMNQASGDQAQWDAAFRQWRNSGGHWSIISRRYSRWGAAKVVTNGNCWYTLVCE